MPKIMIINIGNLLRVVVNILSIFENYNKWFYYKLKDILISLNWI
jgi:hypothetical protein